MVPSDTIRQATMKAMRLGITSGLEYMIYMREDCHICRSEGFAAKTRVEVTFKGQTIIATVSHVNSDILGDGSAGLSDQVWRKLALSDGDEVEISHPKPLTSMSKIRAKLYGVSLRYEDFREILDDILEGRLSDVELAAFVSGCTANDLSYDECIGLTRAMVEVGEKLHWNSPLILDKHCVGGLPGNRTTPIVVSVVASFGLLMPKTSSRAITSPAGTADVVETMTRVDLDFTQIQKVVYKEGGCLAWGGSVNLSPADDMLIRVERALDVDSDGQLVASVISKKIAAGATHLVLDIPYGATSKIRNRDHAERISDRLLHTAAAFNIQARTILSDGSQPVGNGIGPSLEALDVLAVLRGDMAAPDDLLKRSVVLAGELLELSGTAASGQGEVLALEAIRSGRAYDKFLAICKAQGGFSDPPTARFQRAIPAPESGTLTGIDNRRLAKLAKLLGAPDDKAAGILLEKKIGGACRTSELLMSLHAETRGELDYAHAYWEANKDMFEIGGTP